MEVLVMEHNKEHAIVDIFVTLMEHATLKQVNNTIYIE